MPRPERSIRANPWTHSHEIPQLPFLISFLLALIRSILRKYTTYSEYNPVPVIERILELPVNRSLLLFGARNTGKSTLIQQTYPNEISITIDLLDPIEEERFARNPNELKAIVLGLPDHITHIIIDEIQKVPKLLNIVHYLIKETTKKFIMTGSSARKLKYGGANLLAGRAFVYHLFPFSFLELRSDFDLSEALHWGLLPSVHNLATKNEKMKFLQTYALTYLKEEIWAEQFIKKLDPFRRFLEVAAQTNGKIVNYANIARDVGADDKTVKEYFHLLEDTLVGFFLEPFHHSFRKRLSAKPKFYFFDTGVCRALARHLSLPLQSTSIYGEIFEHFVINECYKLANYFYPEYKFSYLRTKDEAEVDLIVDRPGLPLLFIEIKSKNSVSAENLSRFKRLVNDFPNCEAVCFSMDIHTKKFENITIYPWMEGVKKYFS